MQLILPDADDRVLVHIRDLHKSFAAFPVLTGIDLSFRRGEVTAVVGPNGAGKTTLIKCLLGLVTPDRGLVEVDGKPVDVNGEYRRGIGYMPQNPSFPENLTGREVISLIRDMRGSGTPIDLALQRRLNVEGELDKPIRTLSGGTRQKISAVVAFLFDPHLLVLDEPTAGLDPVASAAFKDHVRTVRDQGVGVILTSHVMSDLEALSDRVVFLLDGRVRFDGALETLRSETGEPTLERAISRLLAREAA